MNNGIMIMTEWYIKEINDVNFGDKRLDSRLRHLISTMSNSSEESIPQAFNSWGETLAAYRFFNNKNVTPEKILSTHYESTLERIQKESVVLIPQDTTEINFTGRKKIKDMGCLSSEQSQGFFMHPSIAITPEKVCLGVVDLQLWNRDGIGKRKLSKNKCIEEKESYCWIKGYEAANKIAQQANDTKIISISDRGGDIYEMLERTPSATNKAYWIVRSSINRKIMQDDTDQRKIWDKVKSSKVVGEIEFKLPKGKIYEREIINPKIDRSERVVKQEVRACKVTLCPTPRKGTKLSPATINIVHCREVNPPSEKERIEWYLLTSLDVTDTKSVLNVVDYYTSRWQIEIFFKILKSGCNIEKLQFTTFKALSNSIALYMIISWRILYITMMSRVFPDAGCDQIFSKNEWQSVYLFVKKSVPPRSPPTLIIMTKMIASLGGFLGRKHDLLPGPRAMWTGMRRAQDLALMWNTIRGLD